MNWDNRKFVNEREPQDSEDNWEIGDLDHEAPAAPQARKKSSSFWLFGWLLLMIGGVLTFLVFEPDYQNKKREAVAPISSAPAPLSKPAPLQPVTKVPAPPVAKVEAPVAPVQQAAPIVVPSEPIEEAAPKKVEQKIEPQVAQPKVEPPKVVEKPAPKKVVEKAVEKVAEKAAAKVVEAPKVEPKVVRPTPKPVGSGETIPDRSNLERINPEQLSSQPAPQVPSDILIPPKSFLGTITMRGVGAKRLLLSIREDGQVLNGEAEIEGMAHYTLQGKFVARGLEFYLFSGESQLRFTGAESGMSIRGRFFNPQTGENGSWEATRQ